MAKARERNTSKYTGTIDSGTLGYSVLSPEFHNINEAQAAASCQEIGVQSLNAYSTNGLTDWIKEEKAKIEGG